MTIPEAFTAEAVAAAADQEAAGYRFVTSGEPYRSLVAANPWTRPPRPGADLVWGAGHYYDTTVARLHPHWQGQDLPQPTKDIRRLRADFSTWGYCLVEDGTSPEQTQALHARVEEQAAAERTLGIAYLSAAQQHVWALVNKGRVFEACMQHDPAAVQSGPLLEQLLDETLGPGWHHLSFLANMSFPGCHPQGLHQDQSLAAPFVFPDAPILVNTVYILQDVDEVNGGTLIVPGSHRLYCEGGGRFDAIPPPVNLEAPAGTVLLMDGRVLHAGAVNRSERLRYIITNSVVRPFIRQQEAFHLSISPEVLQRASDKFLWRCGFQATPTRSMVEGFGYFGSGAMGDANGALLGARMAMDAGTYRWVGELTAQDVAARKHQQATLATLQDAGESRRAATGPLAAMIDGR